MSTVAYRTQLLAEQVSRYVQNLEAGLDPTAGIRRILADANVNPSASAVGAYPTCLAAEVEIGDWLSDYEDGSDASKVVDKAVSDGGFTLWFQTSLGITSFPDVSATQEYTRVHRA